MKKILFAISTAVLISACGGGDTATAEKPKQDSVPQTCTYSYDPEATTIGFGAFKFTEKKEVKGGFLKFDISGVKQISTDSIGDFACDKIFEGAQFAIDVEGLDTKDQARDFNIKSTFFKVMDSTSFITGKVLKVEPDSSEHGLMTVLFKLNNVEKEIELAYEKNESDASFNFTGTINLNDFKAQKALASLNNTCKELHRGSDGKSVTWPEVNIYVSTTLKKNCK